MTCVVKNRSFTRSYTGRAKGGRDPSREFLARDPQLAHVHRVLLPRPTVTKQALAPGYLLNCHGGLPLQPHRQDHFYHV
jgi:hypothetical protein